MEESGMSLEMKRLASEKHAHLATFAFCRYRSLVQTGIMSEAQLQQSIVRNLASNVPHVEAIETIWRAFALAKGKNAKE
jgi:hypothetical protein